jgi:hypothetical protein
VIARFSTFGAHVGEVELGPGPEYFVTLSAHSQDDPRDIPAILAHEVLPVFLHRRGSRHADPARNEILTDTATLYLGIGRPMPADAASTSCRGVAADAYRLGHQRALEDYARPPLAGADRRRYEQDRRAGRSTGEYRFEAGKVAFACPACGQGARLPLNRTVRARCPVCRSVFACET